MPNNVELVLMLNNFRHCLLWQSSQNFQWYDGQTWNLEKT